MPSHMLVRSEIEGESRAAASGIEASYSVNVALSFDGRLACVLPFHLLVSVAI